MTGFLGLHMRDVIVAEQFLETEGEEPLLNSEGNRYHL